MADEQMTDTASAAAPEAAEQPQADTLLTSAPAEETSDTAEAAAVDEGTGDDAGEKAGDEGQDGPPETYADFAMPEGMDLDATALEAATPMFKELGLSQDQAQKVVSFYAEQVKAGEQRQSDAFNQLMDDWRTQSLNDKEFGGDKFEESVGVAQRAIEKFGSPELKKLLNEHGVGNHPELIRMMVKVGKLTQEDVPGGSTAPVNKEMGRVERLYPTSDASA